MPETGLVPNGKFLRILRAKQNLTIERAAKKAGIGSRSWARYENGHGISRRNLHGIAKAFGVNPEHVVPELAIPEPSPTSGDLAPVDINVTTYGPASAGNGRIIPEDAEPLGSERISEDVVAYQINGHSMTPIVLDGQRVMLDKRASVRDGDLALIRLNTGQMYCKRYYEDRKLGVAVLQSQDQTTGPVMVRLDNVAEIYKIIGVLF